MFLPDAKYTPDKKEQMKQVLKKWTTIVEALKNNPTEEIDNIGIDSCAFCKAYNKGLDLKQTREMIFHVVLLEMSGLEPDTNCLGCPIYQKTKIQYCHGTPYDGVIRSLEGAQAELDFLKQIAKENGWLTPEIYSLPDVENPTKEEALAKSIKKWELVVQKLKENIAVTNFGRQSCPFCRLYYIDYNCGVCPVKEKTGFSGCLRTPYEKIKDNCHLTMKPTAENIELAEEELEFLKSLIKPCEESLTLTCSFCNKQLTTTDLNLVEWMKNHDVEQTGEIKFPSGKTKTFTLKFEDQHYT